MPTFPTWPGELPRCLDPLNWRHYSLLLYWIFFRPTALKCYLYQADPELYRSEGGNKLKRTMANSAYRQLVVVALGALVWIGLLSIVLQSLVVLISAGPWTSLAGIDHVSKLFSVILPHVVSEVVGGVAVGVAGGVAFGVAAGVAFGVAVGVAFGVAFGVALGVDLGVALGVDLGVALGVALGVPVGVARGGPAGWP